MINLAVGDFPYDFDNDLNGVMSANSLDPLLGEWVLTVYATDGNGDHCDSTVTTVVEFLEASDPACITIGIDEENLESVSLYPNPTSGTFVVELNGMEGAAELTILDMRGRQVFAENLMVGENFRHEFNLKLATGSYMLRLISEEAIETQRLIIK